jgi:hypothetical protein
LQTATRSVLAVGSLLFASACPSESSEKSEAATVSRAVTAVRDADNQKKRELLSALRETACETPDICAVRSACLAAYELHVEVLARMEGVMWLADAQSGAVGAVDQMKRDLARSRELASKCTDLQGELIRRYRL